MYDRIALRIAAWLVLVPVAALSAVGQAATLEGSAWVLETLAGRAVAPQPAVTLRFEQGQVQGNDGCNQYRGPYTADGANIRLGGTLMSTQMACPDPVMRQARAFADALSKMRASRIAGKRLVLLDASGAELARFTAQAQGLAGTSWRVTGYNNGKQAVVSVRAGTTLTLQFSSDGKLIGSGGCNRYTGPYTTSGDGLGLGPFGTTRRACAQPEGVMQQEAAFLQALVTATRARIDADRLELRTAAGALAVTALRDSTDGSGGLRLPATFRGVVPCADCEGIRDHLDLWPDQVFHLRREWLGRGLVRDDIGRWSIGPQRAALVLRGGRGDNAAAPTPTPTPTNASPGGIWNGTSSASGLAVTGLITEAGEFHLIQADGVQYFGTLTVSGNSVSGSFTGVTAFGSIFQDGSTTGTGTISGTIQARTSASLSTTFRTSRGASNTSNIPLTFNALYNRPSSLATIAGNYRDTTSNAVINVNSNGVVFEQDPATGCVINGTIAIINATYNAYRVDYSFSSCRGTSAPLNGTSARGIGTLDNTVAPERAIIGVVNGTAGYSLAGAFPGV